MYSQVYEIMDWGPVVSKLIINAGKKIDALPIESDTFAVTVKRTDPRIPGGTSLAGGTCKIRDIYVSDARGNKADRDAYITLRLFYAPDYPLSSPMNLYEERFGWINCAYRITQQRNRWAITKMPNEISTAGKIYRPQVDIFNLKNKISYTDSQFGNIPLGYADYKPRGAHGGSHFPLIIWLHGLGSGGTDITLPISANRACHFASAEVQALFGEGAYVLVPQSPSFWMDEGKTIGEHDPISSKYTRALKNLIDTYIDNNPGIDRSRIYIGGCSNGGYMTMVMILEYPDYFAAAFPVCSAARDSRISDKQLRSIRSLPIWFTNAASDKAVAAPLHSLATYDRMVKLGAPQVYYSYPRDVHDLYGHYTNAKGGPYEYSGHNSWIYVYNNALHQHIDGKDIGILNWLALQSK
ncbi:hypothetical protein AGMMS49546_04990 [Spirochaetia bacterium]|nr:hypothetical protein AGMMS49546_04990 [Spirochaetia bacterium]